MSIEDRAKQYADSYCEKHNESTKGMIWQAKYDMYIDIFNSAFKVFDNSLHKACDDLNIDYKMQSKLSRVIYKYTY